jgi:hypothetical protein
LASAWIYSRTHAIEAEVIRVAGRSAVILPIDADLSSFERHTLDAEHERVIQALTASGIAHVRSKRRTRWFDGGAPEDAKSWNADYALQIKMTSANDQLRGMISIIPADSTNPLHHEQFQMPGSNSSTFVDTLASHASEDLAVLAVLLNKDKVAQMREWGTENVDAYRNALEGDSLQLVQTNESQMRAEQMFARPRQQPSTPAPAAKARRITPDPTRPVRRTLNSTRQRAACTPQTPTSRNPIPRVGQRPQCA